MLHGIAGGTQRTGAAFDTPMCRLRLRADAHVRTERTEHNMRWRVGGWAGGRADGWAGGRVGDDDGPKTVTVRPRADFLLTDTPR